MSFLIQVARENPAISFLLEGEYLSFCSYHDSLSESLRAPDRTRRFLPFRHRGQKERVRSGGLRFVKNTRAISCFSSPRSILYPKKCDISGCSPYIFVSLEIRRISENISSHTLSSTRAISCFLLSWESTVNEERRGRYGSSS